jgi:hypothetical protein
MYLNLPVMGGSSEDDASDSSILDILGFGSGREGQSTIGLLEDFLKGRSSDPVRSGDLGDLGGLLGGGSSGKGDLNLGQLGLALGLSSFLKDRGAFSPDIAPVGYQGEVPRYTAVREQVTGRDDTDRRPGSGGRRYFSDTIYAKKPEGQEPMSVEEARAAAKAQAAGFMKGGSVLQGGGYLQGDSDGQADLIPADIDGVQEARLSHGEFVLPADVVAMLGNGNSDAGAEALDEFMSMVRTKATGTPKQQKNIDADQVLMMLSKRMG